jgi:hypothetical protein
MTTARFALYPPLGAFWLSARAAPLHRLTGRSAPQGLKPRID